MGFIKIQIIQEIKMVSIMHMGMDLHGENIMIHVIIIKRVSRDNRFIIKIMNNRNKKNNFIKVLICIKNFINKRNMISMIGIIIKCICEISFFPTIPLQLLNIIFWFFTYVFNAKKAIRFLHLSIRILVVFWSFNLKNNA